MTTQTSSAPLAQPPIATERFGLSVTFEMPGITWDYVNELYSHYRFHEYWPGGMLCHITGVVEDGVRSVGLWTDSVDEQKFFRQIAVPVITNSISAMGPAIADAETVDFEPISRPVTNMLITPLARVFADIGVDAQATAVFALGEQPVAVRFEREDGQSTLGDNSDGLIIAWTEGQGREFIETQVWASSEHAVRAGVLADGAASEIDPLKRISFSAAELAAAGI